MSAARVKPRITFDALTRELWRVAEDGDVNELDRILSRGVDVDARNEHGMTALMKAAHHGHVKMVRALLDQGADPNLTRNDKFTALALAAFFGHTETVRVLIEHGAKTEIVTRFGTSPRMWAAARTFKDVARCLEQRRPTAVPPIAVPPTIVPSTVVPLASKPAPVIAREPVSRKPAPVPVVKTLSEPPEIWDLVHEVPRGFNARSAFFARLSSMKKVYAAGVFAVLLLIVGGGVAWVLRNSEARSLPPEPAPVQTAVETTVAPPVSAEISIPEAPPVSENDVVSAHAEKKTPVWRPQRSNRSTPIVNENVPEVVVSSEAPAVSATVATPQFEKPKPAAPVTSPKSPPSTALSPQLVTPAKSAAPKSKVIQWP